MRYWLIYTGTTAGPYTPQELWRHPDFTLESLVCPEGAGPENPDHWKPANQFPEIAQSRGLFPAEVPAQAPKPEARAAGGAGEPRPPGGRSQAGSGGAADGAGVQFGTEGPVIAYQPPQNRYFWRTVLVAALILAGGLGAVYYRRHRAAEAVPLIGGPSR